MKSGVYKEVAALGHDAVTRARQTVGMVVTCTAKEVSLSAAEWTLVNLLTPGDLLILLCIYGDEVEKTTAPIESSCRDKRVFFERRSKTGDVKSLILEEVNAVSASLVTLDRNLNLQDSGDLPVIQESLSCKIFMMPEIENVDLMQKPGVVAESCSSYEADESTFAGSDLGSPFFTINIMSPGYTDDTGRTWDKVKKTTAPIESSCRDKMVFFERRSKTGDVKSLILEEVNAVSASLVKLDRNLNLQESGDLPVIQESLSCKIFMMPEIENVELMQKPVDVPESCSSNEADESTFAGSDLGSPFFTINVMSPGYTAMCGSVPIVYGYLPAASEACFAQSISPAPVFSAEDSSLDTRMRSDDSSPSSDIRFLLPGTVHGQTASTSFSSTPANFRKRTPTSASDSNFGTHAAASTAEWLPVHTQPGICLMERLFKNAQYRSKSSLGQSLNTSKRSHWLAKDYTISETDAYQAMDRLSPPAKNLEQQRQHYAYAERVIRAAFPEEQTIFDCTEKPLTLSWSSLPKVLPKGGQPFLCSVCKQLSPVLWNLPRRFSYNELKEATNNFAQSNFLAEGGFGFVYRGELNGQVLAVKQHKLASIQGYKEFRSEVELLSCAQHRNLVILLGCCDEDGHRILVYEFVCNKSLDWHLSPTKSPKSLEWAARLKIAIGAARALRYLHEECRVGCIVHRDFRPNNILLTHEYEPMVGDFGLARSHSEGEAIETQVMGTFGYLAPEYAESGQVSWKADVYAFGVVLLELITGRKAIDLSRPPGQQSLTEWARPKLLDNTMMAELVDVRLENFPMGEMRAMMQAASHCITKDPAARPRMSQVLHILENETKSSEEFQRQSVELTPRTSASQSTTMQQPARSSVSRARSLKNQLWKQPSGSSNSSKPRRLLYEDML